MSSRTDVVVVGAGQGGLGLAKLLGDAGVDVVVLERGRIGETWLSQRWESFCLNTPNWMNGLPGAPYAGDDPDGFMTHHELVESFEAYVKRFDLDVRTGVNVRRAAASGGQEGRYVVEGDSENGDVAIICSSVVIASGIANAPSIPPVANGFPNHIVQLSTPTYRAPDQLPDGAVLVVGGGQSGGQIVEDLLESGRTVYFAISKVGRLPRRYRGLDFMHWMKELGIWDASTSEADPEMINATNPLTSGVGPRGHTVSFQDLATRGARLMGRLEGVRSGVVTTNDRVVEYMTSSDEFSQEFKDNVDAYITETGMDAPEPEPDDADVSLAEDLRFEVGTRLDLEEAGIRSVIWCTGFTADFSWIELPVIDDRGIPEHQQGVSGIPGIFFIGFPWLSTRKSGVVFGIEEDATHIAETIVANSND